MNNKNEKNNDLGTNIADIIITNLVRFYKNNAKKVEFSNNKNITPQPVLQKRKVYGIA